MEDWQIDEYELNGYYNMYQECTNEELIQDFINTKSHVTCTEKFREVMKMLHK
jgi:hypothetical protein